MNARCDSPLSVERVNDYFAGELSRAEAEGLEEHVFDCAACARVFERAGALAASLRALVPPVITHHKLDALQRAGLSIRITRVDPGVPVSVRFSPGISLLVHALRAQLADADRVDVEVLDRRDRTLVELAGIPVDRQSGEVLIACQRHYQFVFSEVDHFRIWAVQGEARRALGDYRIEHIWE